MASTKTFISNSKEAVAERKNCFYTRHETFRREFSNGNFDFERDQLNYFVHNVTMTQDDIYLREEALDDLMYLLKSAYPKARVYPFGSFISRLGDTDSDLDVFIDCFGDSTQGGNSKDATTKRKVFKNVSNILWTHKRKYNALFNSIVTISGARVPIIKFVHIKTNIHIDASFENILSVRNSELIRFLVELDPRIRPLICLIRYWGRYHDIIDSTKIKNYGLILLTMVFLKHKKILPSVYELQHWDKRSPQFRIDYWNASFYSDKFEILKYLDENGRPPVVFNPFGNPSTMSILDLALEFFEFYKDFPADAYIVCTLTASFISRDFFVEGQEYQLPEELADYKAYCAQDETEIRRLRTLSTIPFIVQDPFALNYNVSAVTRQPILYKFLQACQYTANRIHELKSSRNNRKTNFNLMDVFCEINFSKILVNRLAKDLTLLPQKTKDTPRNFAAEVRSFVDNELGLKETTKSMTTNVSSNIPLSNESLSKRDRTPLYKTEFTLSPSADFKTQFYHKFYQPESGLSNGEIIHKGKVLWWSYMKDFFTNFFSKCYGLTVKVEIQEIDVEEMTGLEATPKNEPRKMTASTSTVTTIDSATTKFTKETSCKEGAYPNPFFATSIFKDEVTPQLKSHSETVPPTVIPASTSRSKRQRSVSSSEDFGNSQSRVGLPSLSIQPPPTKYIKGVGPFSLNSISSTLNLGQRNQIQLKNMTSVKGSDQRSMDPKSIDRASRDKILSISTDEYKPFVLILQCEGRSTVWEGRAAGKKAVLKSYSRYFQVLAGALDPMDLEEEITKQLLVNSAPFRFECRATFHPSVKDLSIHVEVKESMFEFRKPSRSIAAISSITDMLKRMQGDYVLYRYTKWLAEAPPSG